MPRRSDTTRTAHGHPPAVPERCCETNPGTEDCGVVAACLCCATCQMVRHELGDHEGGRPYYLCSPLDSKA